jgi:D-glycero-D-manno-heptose 1,7-bisphosphate phosphatase
MQKAIFLDRDGTINREVNYLVDKEDLEIIPGVKKALILFKELGYLNIVITNQSAVARGYLTENELRDIHDEFKRLLIKDGKSLIDDFFYSPYHIEGKIEKYNIESNDRKPNTGLILKAREKYNIDLNKSFFIGDSYTDMKCAENSKIKKILVLTGYGNEELIKCKSENIYIDYIAKDLLDASEFIKNYKN